MQVKASGTDSATSSAPMAHVSPRVQGVAIHKPKINIQRLGMEEIHRYQQQQLERQQREQNQLSDEGDQPSEEEEVDDQIAQDEEEPLQPQPVRATRFGQAIRMSMINEETEREEIEQALSDVSILATPRRGTTRVSRERRRRSVGSRRASAILPSALPSMSSPVVLLHDASDLLSQYNLQTTHDSSGDESDREDGNIVEDVESTDEDTSGGPETVLLMPRLVLERVKLKDVRKSGKKSLVKSSQHSDSREPRSPGPSPSRRETFVVPQSRQTAAVPQAIMKTFSKNYKEPTEENSGADKSPPPVSEPASESTPTTRESAEAFAQRLLGEDPLEGPSWLFDDQPRDQIQRPARRGQLGYDRKKRSSITMKTQLEGCSKKLDMSDEQGKSINSPQEVKKGRKTVTWNPSLEERNSSSQSEANRLSDQDLIDDTLFASNPLVETINEEPETVSSSGTVTKQDHVNGGASEGDVEINDEDADHVDLPSSPVTTNNQSIRVDTPDLAPTEPVRPRRRAAAAASSCLVEPSLGKKMRQGDQGTNSVYSDYVPEVKAGKGKKRKSGATGKTGVDNAKKQKKKSA